MPFSVKTQWMLVARHWESNIAGDQRHGRLAAPEDRCQSPPAVLDLPQHAPWPQTTRCLAASLTPRKPVTRGPWSHPGFTCAAPGGTIRAFILHQRPWVVCKCQWPLMARPAPFWTNSIFCRHVRNLCPSSWPNLLRKGGKGIVVEGGVAGVADEMAGRITSTDQVFFFKWMVVGVYSSFSPLVNTETGQKTETVSNNRRDKVMATFLM